MPLPPILWNQINIYVFCFFLLACTFTTSFLVTSQLSNFEIFETNIFDNKNCTIYIPEKNVTLITSNCENVTVPITVYYFMDEYTISKKSFSNFQKINSDKLFFIVYFHIILLCFLFYTIFFKVVAYYFFFEKKKLYCCCCLKKNRIRPQIV